MEIHCHPEGLELLLVRNPEYDATFEVYGKCPVQAFGTVLGRQLYFHRHEGWSFDVADPPATCRRTGIGTPTGFIARETTPRPDGCRCRRP